MSKIINLHNSINKYFSNFENKYLENIILDKNYNIIFDHNINFNGYFVNGLIYNKNNEITIKINPYSTESILFILMHEITHAINKNKLKELVINYLIQELELIENDYIVSDELICDIAGVLLGNTKFLNYLYYNSNYNININNNYNNFINNFLITWEYCYKNKDIILNKIEYSISNKLIPYTEHEINNFKNSNKIIIGNSYSKIKEFVDDSYKKSNNNKLYIGKVDNNTAAKLIKQLNVNLFNYNVCLKNNAIKHILRKYSNNKEILRGQIPISKNDFYLIPKIILQYDKIEKVGVTKQNKLALKISKTINTHQYNLIVYISDKSKSIEIQTMYIIKKKKISSLCV